ncbi:MAG: response regulator transcription factor [Verrucomicrobia bacterium]|nr:response regulator transcription factor [Verrucomicrobiota bacterium]MDE3099782.1 response regulator transcription factor [Verrucomicrobiota bacterium]
MITVSIVEDHAGTRQSLETLLAEAEGAGIRCLNAFATAEEALDKMQAAPDVALVDINLPGMSGIECVRRLKIRFPALKVLMLTTYEESDLIFNSLRAGASGYLLKKMAPVELIPAIEQAHAGGAPMTMQVARKVVEYFHQLRQSDPKMEQLTPREQETLVLLAKGLLYKEIAGHLGVTVNTVKRHLHAIYEKLHVQSRTEATARYLKGE